MSQIPNKWLTKAIEKESIEYGNRRSISRGGNIIVSSTPGHRLSFKLVTPLLSESELRELDAFREMIGQNGVFTASLPIWSEPEGAATGSPTVRTTALKGSKVIEVDGFSNSTANILKANDYITFANHTKAYGVALKLSGGVIQTYNTNSTGQTTINLAKPLLKDVPAGTAIDTTPLFTLIADTDEWKVNIDAANGKYSSIELPCIEYF